MTMTDPIADLLTRLRNASQARHTKLEVPASRIKREILQLLKQEGYIVEVSEAGEAGPQSLRVVLKYGPEGRPAITGLRRISTPGRRVYAGASGIPRVLGGLGINIVTTSRGLMTGRECAREGLGGEILCEVW
ncbi:MAG TPA: 30S ribosomal protein S8 [Acidobacteriota bacterium]